MNPPFSAIFLTTLIGAGQGLFLMLFGAEVLLGPVATLPQARLFLALGSLVSLTLTAGGLIASFFHLGQPQRAWRGMAMWRTSWLAREGIALPLFMAGVFAYGLIQWFDLGGSLVIGAFVRLNRGIRQGGGSMRIARPPEFIRHVLTAMNMHRAMPIFPDLESALA